MAQIPRYLTGPAASSVRIEVLGRLEQTGIVRRGPVSYYAAAGVVRARVSFRVGEREIMNHEVLLHTSSIELWMATTEMLVNGDRTGNPEILFDIASPEIIMTAKRFGGVPLAGGMAYAEFISDSATYELLVVIEGGSIADTGTVTGEGPAMVLMPTGHELLEFASQLSSEADAAMQGGTVLLM